LAENNIILIIFCPEPQKLIRLFFLSSQTTSTDPRRLHTEHTRFWTREKNRRTEKQAMERDFPGPCPCVLVSCRCSFPSPQPRKGGWIGLASSVSCERGTETPPWCPPHCNLPRTELHPQSMHTHALSPPFTSALSASNTEDQTRFLLLRPNH
jgi:hypothetical protein